MADAPNSFKDPFWSQLAGGVEDKLALPKGLLVAVLTKGERSNADQVSEAGAKTPFQIIPATRKAMLDKYGVDAYLSPENAAEVAGRLLRESLDRNKNDPALAVAEYVGGTNRSNWGPVTRSYVQRVVGALPSAVSPSGPIASVDLPPNPGSTPSTFDRVSAQMKSTVPENAMAKVFAAYQGGQMTPDEAQQFEQDVKSGLVMLPRGASLKGAAAPVTQPGGTIVLPAGVAVAYSNGTMPEADRRQLEQDVRAGLVALPKGATGNAAVPGTVETPSQPVPEQTIGDKLIGTGEAALNAGTGLVGGTIGMLGGGAKQVAVDMAGLLTQGTNYQPAKSIEQAAIEGSNALTYQPRTPSGQEQAGAVGSVLQNALPIAPLTGELATIARGAAAVPKVPAGVAVRAGAEGLARDVGGDAAATAVQRGATKVDSIRQAARDAVAQTLGPKPEATPGTLGSVGSAATDMATQRRQAAADLPVPLRLTKGMETREPAQLKFEVETAKQPELGAPLRQRTVELNDALLRNFDTWVDSTGAEAPTLRAVGTAVDSALVKKSERDMSQVRAAYSKADRSPESTAIVDPSLRVTIGEGENALTSSPIEFLNSRPTGIATATLADHAKQYAVKLGVAQMRDGELVPVPSSIKLMEEWRKEINAATGFEKNDIRTSTILKKLIDAQTEPVAGPLYREARRMRENFAKQYENRAVIAKLLNTKRGTADRHVAFEDVFDHTILRGPLDDVRHVRRVLQTGGPDGQQAWRELQGATLNYVRNEATKNVATDAAGNRVVSAAGLDKAIRELDRDGKLEFIFGKRGAEQLRTVNDLAKWIKTVPPEASINTSNTVSTLLSAFADAGIIGATGGGVPVPVATMARMTMKYIKDEKLRRRISDALGEPVKQAPGRPTGATVH